MPQERRKINVNNEELLKSIMAKMDGFIAQYELDMRGDKDLDNGNRGVIGAIRELQKYNKEYPTIAYQFARNPAKVSAAVVSVFILLMMLYTAGIIEVVAKTFGLVK
jgi:hypothetical protein